MTSLTQGRAPHRRVPTHAGPEVQKQIRIGLVDDHGAVAIALRAAFERTRELRLVASAATVDALLVSTEKSPQIVVLDLRLADGSSPANNVERLTQAGAQVIGYTSGESGYLLRAATRTGMIGIVRKSEPLSALTSALLKAACGQPLVDAAWAVSVSTDPRIADARLSPNEQRVLSLFADGFTAQHVADITGTAVSTIEDYIRRIRAKYTTAGRPAATKVDLYKRAIEDGFLPSPSDR